MLHYFTGLTSTVSHLDEFIQITGPRVRLTHWELSMVLAAATEFTLSTDLSSMVQILLASALDDSPAV